MYVWVALCLGVAVVSSESDLLLFGSVDNDLAGLP